VSYTISGDAFEIADVWVRSGRKRRAIAGSARVAVEMSVEARGECVEPLVHVIEARVHAGGERIDP
jgi:hypothetical protein